MKVNEEIILSKTDFFQSFLLRKSEYIYIYKIIDYQNKIISKIPLMKYEIERMFQIISEENNDSKEDKFYRLSDLPDYCEGRR